LFDKIKHVFKTFDLPSKFTFITIFGLVENKWGEELVGQGLVGVGWFVWKNHPTLTKQKGLLFLKKKQAFFIILFKYLATSYL